MVLLFMLLQKLYCVCTQEVVPASAVNTVRELFVPENRLQAVKAEAEALPSFEITKVTL